MSKFLRPSKPVLKNAQHYALIQAFITAMTQADFTASKIVVLLGKMTERLQEENRWYMISRTSELIAQRNKADRRRGSYYARCHAIVRAWTGSGIEMLDDAATRLKKVFDLYKVKTSAQTDEETGQLDNLIRDLSTGEMQDDLAALNLSWMFQQMVEAHEEVKSIRLREGKEVSEKVPGALLAARRRCDETYDELTYLIEAFEKTADDATPYEAFIKKWNGTLKIYQDMLDRKQGSGNSGSTVSVSDADGDDTAESGGTAAHPPQLTLENPDGSGLSSD